MDAGASGGDVCERGDVGAPAAEVRDVLGAVERVRLAEEALHACCRPPAPACRCPSGAGISATKRAVVRAAASPRPRPRSTRRPRRHAQQAGLGRHRAGQREEPIVRRGRASRHAASRRARSAGRSAACRDRCAPTTATAHRRSRRRHARASGCGRRQRRRRSRPAAGRSRGGSAGPVRPAASRCRRRPISVMPKGRPSGAQSRSAPRARA